MFTVKKNVCVYDSSFVYKFEQESFQSTLYQKNNSLQNLRGLVGNGLGWTFACMLLLKPALEKLMKAWSHASIPCTSLISSCMLFQLSQLALVTVIEYSWSFAYQAAAFLTSTSDALPGSFLQLAAIMAPALGVM